MLKRGLLDERMKLVPVYILLTAAALYVAGRWAILHRQKKKMVPDSQADALLLTRLNEKEGSQ